MALPLAAELLVTLATQQGQRLALEQISWSFSMGLVFCSLKQQGSGQLVELLKQSLETFCLHQKTKQGSLSPWQLEPMALR